MNVTEKTLDGAELVCLANLGSMATSGLSADLMMITNIFNNINISKEYYEPWSALILR